MKNKRGMFELNGYNPNEFIDKMKVDQLISAYQQCLKKHEFKSLAENSTIEFIHSLKRKKCCIGPYSKLTLFEIANRLYSDLVILEGAKNIFENNEKYGLPKINSMKLLLSNIKGFDIQINTELGIVHGEAFNVAPSFFQSKVRDSMAKFNKEESVLKGILVFNEDALDDKNENFLINQLTKHEKLIGYVNCNLDQWKNSN